MDIFDLFKCGKTLTVAPYTPVEATTPNLSSDNAQEKVNMMLQTELQYMPNTHYMDVEYAGNLKSQWLVRIVEWLIAADC